MVARPSADVRATPMARGVRPERCCTGVRICRHTQDSHSASRHPPTAYAANVVLNICQLWKWLLRSWNSSKRRPPVVSCAPIFCVFAESCMAARHGPAQKTPARNGAALRLQQSQSCPRAQPVPSPSARGFYHRVRGPIGDTRGYALCKWMPSPRSPLAVLPAAVYVCRRRAKPGGCNMWPMR